MLWSRHYDTSSTTVTNVAMIYEHVPGMEPELAIPSRGSQFHRNYYIFLLHTFKQRGTHKTSAWLHVRIFTPLRAWLHKSTPSLDAPSPIHCLYLSTDTHTRIQYVNENILFFGCYRCCHSFFIVKLPMDSHKNQVIRGCSMKRDRVIFYVFIRNANDYVLSYRHLRWCYFRAENT